MSSAQSKNNKGQKLIKWSLKEQYTDSTKSLKRWTRLTNFYLNKAPPNEQEPNNKLKEKNRMLYQIPMKYRRSLENTVKTYVPKTVA